MGYLAAWRILNAADFGVPQLRPRVVIVALRREIWDRFDWPQVQPHNPPSVGETLYPLMASRGWRGAEAWRKKADLQAVNRQDGVMAAKILLGANPAETPIETPTRFEFVLNLKTAKGLGVVISAPTLLRADEVIE
jgi:site-specific DNA-cytosine methylase